MKILCDRHHAGLTTSLILLFQKRLGWDIYFQQGLEWYPEFWNIYPHIETAKQYLERELEGLPGITLEEFKKTKFDVLLCSVPQHVDMWIKLRDIYQPQAKLIFQVGNAWLFDHSFPIKNIMASAVVPSLMGFHTITYHQEFPLDIFYYSPVQKTKKIYSFINCLGVVDIYKQDFELFTALEKAMPDWEFKSFGGQCRDGALAPSSVVADKMREAEFIFSVKSQGDGYGHSIHSGSAVGRNHIVRLSDYKDKLAEPLLKGVSIVVDNKTPEQIAENIRYWHSETSFLESLSEGSYRIYKQTVNFDEEEIKLRTFLDNLL